MESTAAQIERHQNSIRRIRRTIPLIMVVVFIFGYNSMNLNNEDTSFNSWIMICALCVYCLTFVVSYLKHRNKIKQLQQNL